MLRADLFHEADTALETLITTKAAFRSKDQAESEVQRLNALHPDGSCRYWCSFSRLFADGESPGDCIDPA